MPSFYPGVSSVLSVQSGAGTPLGGTTSAGTAAVISKNPAGAAYLWANYFPPFSGTTQGIKVQARGIISTTATPQTLAALGVYANSTQGTVGTALGPSNGGSAISIASLTNAFWFYDADITCTATGSSGTWLVMGFLTVMPTSGNAATTWTVGSTTAVTLSTESAYYLELSATWTNANTSASSTITCEQYAVYGVN